jgi:hypothetical protein
MKKNTHWLFSKQIDSVVKYTLIVFKDKLHYFFLQYGLLEIIKMKKNTHWLFSKQIDSVVKYTLIVFKDKLHYFFLQYGLLEIMKMKKKHILNTGYFIFTHTIITNFNFEKWITVFFSAVWVTRNYKNEKKHNIFYLKIWKFNFCHFLFSNDYSKKTLF